mmetsp:Transcript_86826/g.225519  ORF Transcript_86826/g.225519 Transcript_86826/m.225519 type:complete len:208 (+) Transcript_86826:34-657(+)
MPFSSSCLACDHVDRGEENFEQQLPRERKAATSEKRGAANASGSSGGGAAGGGTEVSASPPERSRLQEFVKDFAKCAVRGCNCEIVDGGSGSLFSAFYIVDASLQKLTLRRSQPQANQESIYRELELARIRDVLDFEASKAQLPEAVLRAVEGDGMRERLLVISFSDGTPAAFLLEGSAVDRDRFMMCVKILRLYAQTHGSTDGSSA